MAPAGGRGLPIPPAARARARRALRGELERYAQELEDARLDEAHLSGTFPARVVLRYACVQGTALVLGLPVALWGLVVTACRTG